MKINLDNNLTKAFRKPKHDSIMAVESWDPNLQDERTFEGILINFKFPFSYLDFEYEDSLTALGITLILSSGGFNYKYNFNIYINNKVLEKKFDTNQFEDFLINCNPYLKNGKNTICLEFLKKNNFNYTRSITFYWDDEDSAQ